MEEATPVQETDDVTLLAAVRAGDAAAFGTLYQRHEQCARRLAYGLVGTPAEVDDAVAEAFARVLDTIKRGGGPTAAFRPYLLTTVRRVCYDRLRGQQAQVPTEAEDLPDPGEPFTDPAVAILEQSMIARAFQSLPERWSAVLWHTEIEESSPAELMTMFGLTANGVAALKYRAKEGLRRAYLQEHITNVSRPECAPIAGRLGAFIRKALPKREAAAIDGHIGSCDDCRSLYAELADIDVSMRGVIAPLILGGGAAAYLAGAHGGTAAGAGSAAGAAGWRLASQLRHAPRQQLLAAGMGTVVVAAAVVALAMALTGSGTPVRGPADRPAQAALVPPLAPRPVPHRPSRSLQLASRPSSGPVPGHAPSPGPRPAPSRTPSPGPHPSPSPTPGGGSALAATVDVYPRPPFRQFRKLVFQATDTGTGTTGQITASISLPAGSHPAVFGHWSRNWTCQSTGSGATCQHGALTAGSHTQGIGYIVITSDTACGKPVAVTLRSGSAAATAESPQVIQCPNPGPRNYPAALTILFKILCFLRAHFIGPT